MHYRAIVSLHGSHAADLAHRLRHALAAHPTLSVDSVRVEGMLATPACTDCGGTGCNPVGATCECVGWRTVCQYTTPGASTPVTSLGDLLIQRESSQEQARADLGRANTAIHEMLTGMLGTRWTVRVAGTRAVEAVRIWHPNHGPCTLMLRQDGTWLARASYYSGYTDRVSGTTPRAALTTLARSVKGAVNFNDELQRLHDWLLQVAAELPEDAAQAGGKP